MNRLAIAIAVAAPLVQACGTVGCLKGNDANCVVPSPCDALAFTCTDGTAEVWEIQPGGALPKGMDALGAPGDIVLANEQIVAVLDATYHPHYIAPTGGALLDLYPRGADSDSLRHVFQATGLLPFDAAAYTTTTLIDDGDVKGVQFLGTLDDRPDVIIATRYEIRPCEPGIRVRTEVVNRSPDPAAWFVLDGWYFGGRELLPFIPGAGFEHPSFGLSTVPSAMRDFPYFVAATHTEPAASYSAVACEIDHLRGFHSEDVSAVGMPERTIPPRGFAVYERFIAVGDGPSVSDAADVAFELRRQLWSEPWAVLEGTVAIAGGGAPGVGLSGLVTVYEGDASTAADDLSATTQVLPDGDGRFSVRVPADRSYVVQVEAYGRVVASAAVDVPGDGADVGVIELPEVGELTLDVAIDGESDYALVFVEPADDATADAVSGTFFGAFDACAPLLGHPHQGSPACNRVLVDGPTDVAVPPGEYDVYATAGPFVTLAHERVTVGPSTSGYVTLDLQTLALQPEGALSADFHVHGGASFDSSLPDLDRVRSFLAARVDVIASTDHDVMNDYAEARQTLGADERLALIAGVETTGHILWNFVPGTTEPRVIGHWNFWPVPYDPEGAYRGAAWDEKVQPAQLFDRMEAEGFDPTTGVIQLNHPIGDLDFGRDVGWASTIDLDATVPLPTEDDGTAQGLYFATPDGTETSNADYNVQEVMNGTSNETFEAYRAFWFYLLNQGVFRGGTANSDSHSLGGNILGTPRTLVWSPTAGGLDFVTDAFDLAVREGKMIGTNGPIVLVSTTDVTGEERGPSLAVFAPGDDATLDIEVHAAPWVPVDEVRIVVNGEVVRVLDPDPGPVDLFGTDITPRLVVSVPLSEVLPADGDAWIVVEAGAPLVDQADLDCDGIPDTGDNNGDGSIDWRDVDDLDEDPGVDCLDDIGPLARPDPPDRGDDRYPFTVVVPDGYPLAFTNPLILDLDGGGFRGVGP